MGKYTSFGSAADFFRISLSSFQNLTEDEKKYYKEQSDKLLPLQLPEVLKVMALGFLFIDLSGEENLKDVCAILDQQLANAAATTPTPAGPASGATSSVLPGPVPPVAPPPPPARPTPP